MCNVSVGLPTLGVVQKLAGREKTLQNGYLQMNICMVDWSLTVSTDIKTLSHSVAICLWMIQ